MRVRNATDDEAQGTLGRTNTRGEARFSPTRLYSPYFSTRERRLGTRQLHEPPQENAFWDTIFKFSDDSVPDRHLVS